MNILITQGDGMPSNLANRILRERKREYFEARKKKAVSAELWILYLGKPPRELHESS